MENGRQIVILGPIGGASHLLHLQYFINPYPSPTCLQQGGLNALFWVILHTLSKSSSGSGGRGNKPPSIVYAPSKHSSSVSFNYDPPVITKHAPHPTAVPMQRTPSQHPSAHLPEPSRHSSRQRAHSPSRSQPPPTQKVPTSQPLIPSYSDPTYNRDHYTTGASRHYKPPHHGGQRSSGRQAYDRYGRAPSPDERGHRGGGYTYDDRQRDSHSSGSTYYVIPS